MRQAIICTNNDPIHWRIYAALGIDELKRSRFATSFAQWLELLESDFDVNPSAAENRMGLLPDT